MRYSTTLSIASAAALTLLSTLLTVQSPAIALAAVTVRDTNDLLYMRESHDKVVFAAGEDNDEDEIESDSWWQEIIGERLEKRRGDGGGSHDKVVFASGEDNDEDEIESDSWWQEVTGERLEKRRGGGGGRGGGSSSGSSGGRSGGGRTGGSSSSAGRTSG
jgi:uncharacterized membrane protein YgcG